MSHAKINLFEQVAVDQVQAFYRGTQAAIEALTGLSTPSCAFGWTSDPSDGEFGFYNGVEWIWMSGTVTIPEILTDDDCNILFDDDCEILYGD